MKQSADSILFEAQRHCANEVIQRAKTTWDIALGLIKRTSKAFEREEVLRQKTEEYRAAEALLLANAGQSQPAPGSLTDILRRLERSETI